MGQPDLPENLTSTPKLYALAPHMWGQRVAIGGLKMALLPFKYETLVLLVLLAFFLHIAMGYIGKWCIL